MMVFFSVDNAMLTDYILYLSKSAENTPGGVLKLSETNWFGALVVACCRVSERPVPRPSGEHVVAMELPVSRQTQSLENKWLYISKADNRRLNLALKALFDMDLYSYYLKARELGIQKKDAVDAFIASRGLISADAFEALHKRIYRRESAAKDKLAKKLMRKIYYINESADYSLLNDLNNIKNEENN